MPPPPYNLFPLFSGFHGANGIYVNCPTSLPFYRFPFNSDPRYYMTPPGEPGVVRMRDFVSGYPLLDRATFDLTSETSETEASFYMLELQWDVLRMAALCGAVDAGDDPNWNPGEDDTSLNLRLLDDLSHG